MSETSTQDRLLDAAEVLFADQGFSTSLRSITASAGVNLAAVNYPCGSKDVLIQEVFARRLEPLNRERLRLLDELESAEPDVVPSLERIVEALRDACRVAGRDPDEIEVSAAYPGRFLDDPSGAIDTMAGLGIGRLMVPAYPMAKMGIDAGMEMMSEIIAYGSV